MDSLVNILAGQEQLWVTILAVSAVGLGKILEKFLNKDVQELNESLEMRKALREEVNSLHTQLKEINDDLDSERDDADEWRSKFWKEVQLNSEHQLKILQLKQDLEDTKSELQDYKELALRLTSPQASPRLLSGEISQE